MRAHNHQLRAHPVRARAVALARPRHDGAFDVAALAVVTGAVFAALAAGWGLGGVVLRTLGVTG